MVYAAEEPVTLAQLAAVFGPEVREIWQAEQKEAETPVSDGEDEAPTEEPSAEAVGDAPVTSEADAAEPGRTHRRKQR